MSFRYKISISFHLGDCPSPIGGLSVPYFKANGVTKADHAKFYKKKVVLIADRKTQYSFSAILTNSALTIHQNIETCILMYYANCINFPKINRITIEAYLNSGDLIYLQSTNQSNTPRILADSVHRNPRLRIMPNRDFVELSDKGKALRISLSYWLEAINGGANQISFERAWTAFNTLYSYYGNQKQEAKNHEHIRNQIILNTGLFTLTKSEASILTTTVLRNYRWILWLKNLAKRGNHNVIENILTGLADNRLKYLFEKICNASKIVDIFKDPTNAVKDAQLRAMYTNILTALRTPGAPDDLEVALILCINYAYYLRNQRFHGGTINSVCKIYPTAEEQEYGYLADRISLLVKEIYEAQAVLAVHP